MTAQEARKLAEDKGNPPYLVNHILESIKQRATDGFSSIEMGELSHKQVLMLEKLGYTVQPSAYVLYNGITETRSQIISW